MNYRTDLFKIDTFRKIMIHHWWQPPILSLIPSKKLFFNQKKVMLQTDSAASIRSHGKYMKYASLDLWWWQHDCKRLAWTLYNIRSYWLLKQHPYTQDSVMSITSQYSLQTLQTTLSDQITFAETMTLKGRCLNTFEYISHHLFYSPGQLYVTIPNPLHQTKSSLEFQVYKYMSYSFFWVIPWCLNFVCWHFGTSCLFHLHRQCKHFFFFW